MPAVSTALLALVTAPFTEFDIISQTTMPTAPPISEPINGTLIILSPAFAKIKTLMPSDVDKKRMRKCKATTLVMAAERDCLFPGAGVIARAEKIIPNCRTYLLRGRGHMNILTEEEKKMIVDFLL